MDKYNPRFIEKKWQDFWKENPDLYEAEDNPKKEKRFILDMFPYPSGEGLHVGHVESYTATDIVSRYFRMNGQNVLHPQGWDAFGLPAENYAIKTKIHPEKTTQAAIKTFKRQLGMMGFSYDWSREINSSKLDYYKWTQWFFLLLYKNGLAYKKKAKVNWCNSCKTVLANEQAEGGICERCKNPVVQKDLEQWFFKITDFIEDKEKTSGLLSGLNKIDWPESTKMLQRNWVGRSEGAIIKFSIVIAIPPEREKQSRDNKMGLPRRYLPAGEAGAPRNDKRLEVFTTRLDTICGCTYCVVAPEHQLLNELKDEIQNWSEVNNYIKETKKKSDLDRMEAKVKTGVEMKGIKAVNPFTGEKLPIYVADYVLSQYGTGAVMAVPAHDERDFEFAKKYKLPIKQVIRPEALASMPRNIVDQTINTQTEYRVEIGDECFVLDGELMNSGEYNGLKSEKARQKMTAWLEKNNLGKKKVNYKLRDWLISRQRYWGAPIPIIYCDKCGIVPVPEKDLPVKLPGDVDFRPTGESPLKYSKKFQQVKCPVCGAKAKRESDTMDTFVCSSWYYFRYADPKNEKEFADKKLIKKWLPVNLYVGGAEHSVLHLLYSRFFTKVLHKLGYIDFDEPFLKLRHQGIILSEDGRKMSKSLGNVVNPDDEVKRYGADSLRLFEMFMGPLEDAKPWQTKGIVGVYRFLEKVYRLSSRINANAKRIKANSKIDNLMHKTIKKVTEDIENLRFNTAISQLMILGNAFEKENEIYLTHYTLYLILLSSFAPHLAEELWGRLGHKESIFRESWPKYDPKLIKDEEIELVVQVNGRVRQKIKTRSDITEKEAKELVLKDEKIKPYISSKKVKKIIFVKGKLVNVVV